MAQVTLARDTAFIAAFDHSRVLHGGCWAGLTSEHSTAHHVGLSVYTAVACWDGSFFRYRFNPLASDGKFCIQESYDVFLDIGDDVL